MILLPKAAGEHYANAGAGGVWANVVLGEGAGLVRLSLSSLWGVVACCGGESHGSCVGAILLHLLCCRGWEWVGADGFCQLGFVVLLFPVLYLPLYLITALGDDVWTLVTLMRLRLSSKSPNHLVLFPPVSLSLFRCLVAGLH